MATPSAFDAHMMRRAINLAATAAGWTNPNPLVGAVLVRDGRIIGEGCHERYGKPHAERNALSHCTEDPTGATLYVTLEPCNHTGKQPPCTDAILEAGIVRVVVGSRDPNPLVAERGNQRLRDAGIRVDTDVLKEECDALNPIFFHFITRKRPLVVAKWAMTMDGKVATRTDDARWVSGDASRGDCHDLRHRLAAIMVGAGTVAADDPALTARRDIPSNQPLRIVCSSAGGLPAGCNLLRTAGKAPLLVACVEGRALRPPMVAPEQILPLPADGSGRPSLPHLMDELGRRGIDSVLVEGGPTLHASLFEADLVDEVIIYLAPKVCGGASAPSPIGGFGAKLMTDAQTWRLARTEQLGDDLKLVYHRAGAPGNARQRKEA